jgi:hypothetical protein
MQPPLSLQTMVKHYILQEYKVAMNKEENEIAFSKETVECLHLTLWPDSKRRDLRHTA